MSLIDVLFHAMIVALVYPYVFYDRHRLAKKMLHWYLGKE